MTETMWAYRMIGPRQLELTTTARLSESDLQPGDILVEIEVGGICGSDLSYFSGGLPRRPLPVEDPIGVPVGGSLHEIVGLVRASRDPSLRVGSHVVGWATTHQGLAELAITPGSSVIEYGAEWSPREAVALQSLACVIYALDRISDDLAGATVAVIGLGPIGVLFSHVAKSRGAACVIGVDQVDRRDLAPAFGVDEFVWSTAERWAARIDDAARPEVVIEAVGHNTGTLVDAIVAVAPKGVVFYFGVPDQAYYAFPMDTFFRKHLTLLSGVTGDRAGSLTKAEQYARAHPQLFAGYLTHHFPIAEAQQAYEHAVRPAPGQLKITIGFDQQSAPG